MNENNDIVTAHELRAERIIKAYDDINIAAVVYGARLMNERYHIDNAFIMPPEYWPDRTQ